MIPMLIFASMLDSKALMREMPQMPTFLAKFARESSDLDKPLAALGHQPSDVAQIPNSSKREVHVQTKKDQKEVSSMTDDDMIKKPEAMGCGSFCVEHWNTCVRAFADAFAAIQNSCRNVCVPTPFEPNMK
jgi:hypothetical protein